MKLEDILEKYGISSLQTLDDILKIHKFLAEHNYSTLPREDFDDLFRALGEHTQLMEDYHSLGEAYSKLSNEKDKQDKILGIIKEIDKTALLHFISVCVKDKDKIELLKEVLL